MSKYTTEVRFICETYSGLLESTGYSDVDRIIESARSKVFDFKYPIFDETYKGVLETKILKHFYTREIGCESVGLWKHWLNTRMNEIMPYYNKLYESELLEFNPLYDVDITREHEGTRTGTKEDKGERAENTILTRESSGSNTLSGTSSNTETGNNSNNQHNYYSDTPQGGVGDLESLSYLTNARKITNSGTNSSNSNITNNSTDNYSESGENVGEITGTSKLSSTINNTEDYLENVRGKQGGTSYAKMLQDYRDTFLNIDMQIIDELSDLFMNLW